MSDLPPPPPPSGGFIPPPPPPPPQPPPGGGGFVPPPPAGYTPGAMAYAGTRNDGLAIASLICGIVGIACFFICLGVVLGPAAAIMGFISRQRIAASGGMLGGGGMALAGLILGIVAFIGSVAWFFTFVYAIPHSGPTPTG